MRVVREFGTVTPFADDGDPGVKACIADAAILELGRCLSLEDARNIRVEASLANVEGLGVGRIGGATSLAGSWSWTEESAAWRVIGA